MEENTTSKIGTTTRGMTVHIPMTFELVATFKRRDIAEALAMFEYLYAHSSKSSDPQSCETKYLDVISFLETMMTTSEAKFILKTKSFSEFLRHGERLLKK